MDRVRCLDCHRDLERCRRFVRDQPQCQLRDTLIVKFVVVSISGVTAALRARARSAVGLAVFGVLTGVSALAALFLGVLLAG